jgi:nucleoside-diphosphate-sugar epimerase
MKILVTGGCGFIGHKVVQILEKMNNEVLIVDNHSTYGSISQRELQYLVDERSSKIQSKIINLDINDFTALYKAFEFNPDVVIHLASFPRQKSVDINPQEGVKTMMEGLINILELSKNRRLIYISSSMVYGDFNGPAKETDPCSPKGLYAVMKYAGERMVKDYANRFGMQYNIIRPSAVYGPLDVGDRVIAKFMLNAITDKPMKVNGAFEKLDFSFVDDTAMGICLTTTSGKPKATYNITRGEGRTLYDAAKYIRDIVGKGEIIVGDKDNKFPSRDALCIDKAKQELLYNPTTDLKTGLENYYDWFKDRVHWFTTSV